LKYGYSKGLAACAARRPSGPWFGLLRDSVEGFRMNPAVDVMSISGLVIEFGGCYWSFDWWHRLGGCPVKSLFFKRSKGIHNRGCPVHSLMKQRERSVHNCE
jgi:hypothetical protein